MLNFGFCFCPILEQQKRRRFHPLRNLRRIFRRRTITSSAVTSTAGTTSAATVASADKPTSLLVAHTGSTSEKNLRSATLSSITSVVSASSPSSPLAHQQLQDAYLTQSLPKSKTSYLSLLGNNKQRNDQVVLSAELKGKSKHKPKQEKVVKQKESDGEELVTTVLAQGETMFTATTTASVPPGHYYQHHHHYGQHQQQPVMISKISQQRQSLGVSVYPGALNRALFTERQNLRSSGDSLQDLDSGNDSGTGGICSVVGGGHNSSANERIKNGSASGGEMSDSQRSLSESRLIDSDYSREGLSQSHDSVFSESATASSLSIVLKAELADVLRKRRNRPDASDEDLGLPRSPVSPQRRSTHHVIADKTDLYKTASNEQQKYGTSTGISNQSEVSSMSLLSMNSADGEDGFETNNSMMTLTAEVLPDNNVNVDRYPQSPVTSTLTLSFDILRPSSGNSGFNNNQDDETDACNGDRHRLSHSAAKHKMAIRPTKRKGPSRQHRRTLENCIPEANEDLNKFANYSPWDVKNTDDTTKCKSLPLKVNPNLLVLYADEAKLTSNTASEETLKPVPSNLLKSTVSTSSNLFSLRSLTDTTSAIFESKDPLQLEEESKGSEFLKKSDIPQQNLINSETADTGFLKCVGRSNGKRSISKVQEEDSQDQKDLNIEQGDPKKLQISTSCFETTGNNMININSGLDKSRSEISYEKNVEEKRREIKREIHSEGKIGLSAMLNNFVLPLADKNASKPKSGPAARQRYMPQNISNESICSLEKQIFSEKFVQPGEPPLPKLSINETFQSTSIIKEITSALQAPGKQDYHFEKKPKIVGLSAFQQKISRSADQFGRGSSTNVSLKSFERSEEEIFSPSHTYIQKQRKSVEKSKSFRTYGETKENVSSVHNNMPSLPDLSLNTKGPFSKDFFFNGNEYSSPSPPEPMDGDHRSSLGFEINDNKLIKGDGEKRRSYGNFDKNIILTTTSANSKSSPTKLLTPSAVVSNLSLSNICNKNITEIENNIDIIVKLPCVSVIRKSIILDEEEEQVNNIIKATGEQKKSPERAQNRPDVLNLTKEKSASEDILSMTHSNGSVVLRDKSYSIKNKSNFAKSNCSDIETQETDRKSAPDISNGIKLTKSFTRRTSGAMEGLETDNASVPEFMKIQLNRVDPARISKSHVVLAKNFREPKISSTTASTPEKSCSTDDLSFRRLSNESVDINERDSPESDNRCCVYYHEAINRQAKSSTGLPPKCPSKKSTPTTPITSPVSGWENHIYEKSREEGKRFHALNTDEITNGNPLSLKERRRLFMHEEHFKKEKSQEEERKKSLPSESLSKYETKNNNNNNHNATKEILDNTVIIRKKSLIANTANHSHSLNNHTVNNGVNGNFSKISRDDSTPELMKVFARRSLKIKDEDIDKLINATVNSNTSSQSLIQNNKKYQSANVPNVDSDKENQSASEEKLDKLPKLLDKDTINNTQANNLNNSSLSSSSSSVAIIRNSLGDFRSSPKSLNHGLVLNNNHNNYNGNNNNNNNNNNINNNNNSNSNKNASNIINGCPLGQGTVKNFLPPTKTTNFRNVPIERNNNYHIGETMGIKSTASMDRTSISHKITENMGCILPNEISVTLGSKTIERSATVGEFKGIHQRRAEWERRAKEALK
uniref:DUF4739 domain-containing protein n=1 Tax=Glossina morsitans morsitans TaxID=37546 RepID=A0A1B0FAX8_GLOMM